MITFPDIDLSLELKHRGFTHTLAGAFIFGILGAILFGIAKLDYALYGFLSGFTGTLAHILGDIFTYTKFKPLWPLSNREIGLGLFRASDEKINRLFAKLGISIFTLVIFYRVIDWGQIIRLVFR